MTKIQHIKQCHYLFNKIKTKICVKESYGCTFFVAVFLMRELKRQRI